MRCFRKNLISYEAPSTFFYSSAEHEKKGRTKLFRDPILEILHEIEQCSAYSSFVLRGMFVIIKNRSSVCHHLFFFYEF